MIKLETAHIEEVRGIRKLDIDFRKETFAVSGPNGSGKSGVIDAIEFGLTGQIGRLAGTGTKGISVAEHGPHVDKTKFPGAAFVELRVHIPGLGKSATITRTISAPKKPKIVPDDADVIAALAEVEDHPELTLSRREILRFILVEPTKRSEEIQTILKLEDIGQTRSALNTAQNKLTRDKKAAGDRENACRDTLQRHLQIATLRADDLLEAVNKRRKLLTLPEIESLTGDTKLDEGLSSSAKATDFNKQSALRDLKALSDLSSDLSNLAKGAASAIVSSLARLETDPALMIALQRRTLIEKGLELIDGPACPLCDTAWDSDDHLRGHLRSKLVKSDEARKLQEELLKNGATVAQSAVRVVGIIAPVLKAAEAVADRDFAKVLSTWKAELDSLRGQLAAIDGLTSLKERLSTDWIAVPNDLAKGLSGLVQNVTAKPDQTAAIDAQTFLTTAQTRLNDYREARRKNKAAEFAANAAKLAYDTYCEVLEDELNSLYEEVQKDFCTFYRAVNGDDEAKFTAKLTPSEGSLGLDVNFYDRGLFPPAAYHSEGHQDGMGVCLYLALMKRLLGAGFTFALLDDVVMSVDADHRYEFCKLLKTHFPETQFIITTHDRLWAEQMKSAGLVTGRTSLRFHSWTVDTGPLVESNLGIWDEIGESLSRGKIEIAAAALRRHLEYVSRHLADQLVATPPFRADGNYELGELLPSVLKRMRELCGKAADAGQSWGNDDAKQAANDLKSALSSSNAAISVEQWAVNRAVHYNEWANFGKKDFEPVVVAFKELLDCFRCDKCDSWLYVTPRVNSESLRCACNEISLNLKNKPR